MEEMRGGGGAPPLSCLHVSHVSQVNQRLMDILTLGHPAPTSQTEDKPEKVPALAEKPVHVTKVVVKPIVPDKGAREEEDLDFLDSLPAPAKAAAPPPTKPVAPAEEGVGDEEWLDDFLGE